jgi:hypothetical protein
MQAHFRPELTGSAPKTFGECGRYLAAVIEGSLGIHGDSDLSRSSISERFDARLHGAGINDEENAGRYSKTDERHIGRQRFGLSLRTVGATSWSGEGYGLLVVSAPDNTAPHYPRNHGNPYIEKGMHTRPQHYLLEAGSYRHENAELHWSWGASEVRHPASFSL